MRAVRGSRGPALVLAAIAMPACAAAGIRYSIDSQSRLLRGCYDPCDCLLIDHGPVQGSMRLSFRTREDGFTIYDVTGVDWTVAGRDSPLHYTGGGEYRISAGPAPQQRLVLELTLDGGSPERFDSEFQPASDGYGRIDVVIDVNNQVCFDTVITVSAARERTPGDSNCDGVVNNFDVDPFVLALAEPDRYLAQFPDCNLFNADINGDGAVNNFDIDPFVELLIRP